MNDDWIAREAGRVSVPYGQWVALTAELARLEREVDRLTAALQESAGACERLRGAAYLALAAFERTQRVEAHSKSAATHGDCADCCNQRPCATWGALHSQAHHATTLATVALEAALAGPGDQKP